MIGFDIYTYMSFLEISVSPKMQFLTLLYKIANLNSLMQKKNRFFVLHSIFKNKIKMNWQR